MPYHYQYDPFYMSPNEMQPLDGEDTTEDKTVMEDSKENNQHDENQNVSFYLLSAVRNVIIVVFGRPLNMSIFNDRVLPWL